MALEQDTIVAIATPAGRGAVGIVRLSGEQAEAIAARHLGWTTTLPRPRWLGRARFVDGAGEVVDDLLAVRFPAPASYTGEAVVELHGHGNPLLLERMVAELVRSGARLARPGEFTERAFLAGKLDLTQAEAVATLIAARSEGGARLARRLLAGELGAGLVRLRQAIVEVEAEVEAAIDFAEEEIDPAGGARLAERLAPVTAEVARLLAGHAGARHQIDGVRVVLVGAVNAGKSSLFNRLLGEERAIVTPEAGTTRDYLEQVVEWEGIEVCLVDTAGLRVATGAAERQGIERSRAAAAAADLLVQVVDGSAPVVDEALPPPAVVAWNKVDLGAGAPPATLGEAIPVSARTGEGVAALRTWLVARARAAVAGDSVACLERHRLGLEQVAAALEAAREGLTAGLTPELIAFELRAAQATLGALIGERTPEQVLEAIFSHFCVGK
ncbi:MAG: tRNA uridine-5-carboxymethylaminomethyl(34) synthesis GTPase MnmE [Nitrospirae bacterium CG18_big_fil_WC_8_21_14_2_50_70_55]|nr:tRNA uridine-5-carboxymethylaminomethyl(34) synthesis GTPase MnmE [Deltaproteobacteria bacterium]OIP65347.1 MAG: tRNA uridine-5-carboxymethylaminomethyl(34) synthesis GTPase MnmE [Nitrospirae bacterium CG2_30_70_394]PIQ05594.1 MAG: tRNA uridine-5-carboxymethylaminomethyl(34) synthesis GTPase MnmE [Nitrospirae bacterium CG18_big_fil_WC_8_21_14_2_50_70_55]PIU77663.1 MAG: tRNA uridine-5-carboxymethylaminomethyl(34) synthesis GTPase MnmE [Nitrospirae bacterium CG06_land_8_20_14_3_00_70_43]PIW817